MSCAKRVRETLSSLENVANVEVDFKNKKATVTMKEGATLDREVASKALKDKGYTVQAFAEKAAVSPAS